MEAEHCVERSSRSFEEVGVTFLVLWRLAVGLLSREMACTVGSMPGSA